MLRAGCTNANQISNLEIDDHLLIRINTPINIYSLHEENHLLTGLYSTDVYYWSINENVI